MRFKVASRKLAWGCAALLCWGSGVEAQDTPAPPAAVPQNDPLAVKPTTIEGKFNAVLLMLKLARTDLGRYYLEQLLADDPSEADLLELRRQHGTGTFLQLTAVEALNPPATELLDRLNRAVQAQVSDPAYADAVLDRLSGSPRERAEALAELQHLGAYAVPPILRRLAAKKHTDSEVLALTLSRLGTDTIPPLTGGLTSPDPEVRAISARMIGQLGGEADSVWLWAPAFTSGEATGVQTAAREALARLRYGDVRAVGRISGEGAARTLLTAATQHLNGKYKWPEQFDELPRVPVWTWGDEQGTVVEHSSTRATASLFLAERLAREASLLAPDLQQASVVLLATLLTRVIEEHRWQTPLPASANGALDLAVTCGPELCEQVLRFGLDQKVPAASLGALQALSQNGSVALLSGAAPHGAVTAALDAPDPRVQFAAAVTILHWDPVTNFRGSRRVVEILSRTLNSDANPAAVVMDPNGLRANETASLFTELGFPASMSSTGMGGFRIAAERGNIELAVLHPNVVRWELSQTIANLRADSRTASIPIIIYGPASLHDQVQRLSGEYRNVTYLDEGNVPLDISKHLRPLLAQISPPPISPEERTQQMAEASFWLRRIANRNVGNVFDLVPAQNAVIDSLGKPDLVEDGLVTLGAIGTVEAQKTLLETATAPAGEIAVRTLAAQQLAFHIQRYELLLSKMETEVLQTMLRTETDPQLKGALASVIGTLKPTAAAARKELLAFPPSPAPLPDTP